MEEEGRTIRVFNDEQWLVISGALLLNGYRLVPVDDMVPGTGLHGFYVIATDLT